MELGTALADQDLAGVDGLAAETLDAQELCVRIAAVLGGTTGLLMCHGAILRCLSRGPGSPDQAIEVTLTVVSSER
ncbi:hypothetical protein ACFFX0_02360 [Citricoccus parietis]|uniref:Uncharacterized protein n=1 Tax=Citricoccus parietis TaxID=592307 RepID=A0ABV5FTU6_9MICC